MKLIAARHFRQPVEATRLAWDLGVLVVHTAWQTAAYHRRRWCVRGAR